MAHTLYADTRHDADESQMMTYAEGPQHAAPNTVSHSGTGLLVGLMFYRVRASADAGRDILPIAIHIYA